MDSLRISRSFLPLHKVPVNGLETPEAARHSADVKRLAEDFEAMLVLQVIRSMESQLEHGSLFGSDRTGDVFGGFAEWEIARAVSKSADVGLKKQLLELTKPGRISRNEAWTRKFHPPAGEIANRDSASRRSASERESDRNRVLERAD